MLKEFFQSKLDNINLGPVISGLFYLEPNYSTIGKIMDSCTITSLPRKDRSLLMELIIQLLENKEIQDVSFIPNFCSSFEGERDPECLLLCFRISLLIVETMDCAKHSTMLVNFSLSYFPITFSHQEELKRELKSSLRKVLASSPLFADQVLPILTDKMKSTSTSVRTDVIETLALCLNCYESTKIDPILGDWWRMLKKEVASSDENKMQALRLIQQIGRKLSNDVRIVELMTTDLNDCLKTSDLQDSNELGKIMISVATVKTSCFESLVHDCLPLVLIKGVDDKLVVQQSAMGLILDFLVAMNLVYCTTAVKSEILDHLPHIMSIVQSRVEDDNLVTPIAIRALGELLKCKALEPAQQESLSTILLKICVNHKYLEECSITLHGIASSNPTVALNYILPPLKTTAKTENSDVVVHYEFLAKGIFHETIQDLIEVIYSRRGDNAKSLQVLENCFRNVDSNVLEKESGLIELIFRQEEIQDINLRKVMSIVLRNCSHQY